MKLQIKVLLTDDMVDKFKAIKERWGLKTDAETIRLIIQDHYRKEILKEKDENGEGDH